MAARTPSLKSAAALLLLAAGVTAGPAAAADRHRSIAACRADLAEIAAILPDSESNLGDRLKPTLERGERAADAEDLEACSGAARQARAMVEEAATATGSDAPEPGTWFQPPPGAGSAR